MFSQWRRGDTDRSGAETELVTGEREEEAHTAQHRELSRTSRLLSAASRSTAVSTRLHTHSPSERLKTREREKINSIQPCSRLRKLLLTAFSSQF